MNLESGNSSEVNFERFWTKSVQLWTMQFYCFYIALNLSSLRIFRNGFDSRRRRHFLSPLLPIKPATKLAQPESLQIFGSFVKFGLL